MTSHIYQIFYNDETRALLDPAYLPLDNTANPRPDWYEFYVILQYMRSMPLNDDDWYGFLSPNFNSKTGLDAKQVYELVEFANASPTEKVDVVLIPLAWDQLAFFQNPFDHGEFWHPGSKELSRRVLAEIATEFDIESSTMYSGNFSFSNYIIAKPRYWRAWLKLANALFELAESRYLPRYASLADELRQAVNYKGFNQGASMKVFLQERLPFVVLATQSNQLVTCSFDVSAYAPLVEALFDNSPKTIALLRECNLAKRDYVKSQNPSDLQAYHAAKLKIKTKS